MAEFLTPQEVADELRVTRRSVYSWLRGGRLEGQRAGKAWRVSREALARFMAERKQTDFAAGWPCPACGGVLHAWRICETFVPQTSFEIWIRCADDDTHLYLHPLTLEQYARARAGDFAWLRGQ